MGRHDPVPRRRWKWLLPLLVMLGAVALVTAVVFRVTQHARTTPEHAVASYLDAVEHGKTERAYAQLCDGFRKAVTYKSFARGAKAERVADGGVTGTHLARIEARRSGERIATYIVRRQAGDTVFDAALVSEHGKWRLCGFRPRATSDTSTPIPPGLIDTGRTTTTR